MACRSFRIASGGTIRTKPRFASANAPRAMPFSRPDAHAGTMKGLSRAMVRHILGRLKKATVSLDVYFESIKVSDLN